MVFKRIILQLLELRVSFEYEETLSISLFINVTQ